MAPVLCPEARAHLHFVVKHFLPHHVASAVIGDDVQQPAGEGRSAWAGAHSAHGAAPLQPSLPGGPLLLEWCLSQGWEWTPLHPPERGGDPAQPAPPYVWM